MWCAGTTLYRPPFSVEAEERARALGVVVGDAKRDRGTHAREAVDEHAEEGAVAKADNRGDINAVEQRARLLRGEHRGFAGLDDVLRAAHRACGVERQDLVLPSAMARVILDFIPSEEPEAKVGVGDSACA